MEDVKQSELGQPMVFSLRVRSTGNLRVASTLSWALRQFHLWIVL